LIACPTLLSRGLLCPFGAQEKNKFGNGKKKK
jgi:hypothetical protein